MFAKGLDHVLSEVGKTIRSVQCFIAETQTYELMVEQGHMIISRSGRMERACHIQPNVKWSARKWEDNGIMLHSKIGAST